MEFMLLAKVGMIIKSIVWGGYSVAGTYALKTGFRYFQDYRDSVANEKLESDTR